MKIMRILLTTYGAFRDVKENVTKTLAKAVELGWDSQQDSLTILNLPVEWGAAETRLEEALGKLQPDVVVAMGHAETYHAVTVEARYFNTALGEDNKGRLRFDSIIKKNGPEIYEANIDAGRLVSHLASQGVPVRLHADKDGMDYLCNFAGYIAMHKIHTERLPTKFIFLHTPPPGDIPYDSLVRGVRETIIFLLTSK